MPVGANGCGEHTVLEGLTGTGLTFHHELMTSQSDFIKIGFLMITTELHRHFEGSIRASSVAELSGRFKSEQEVREKFWCTTPKSSLKEVLDCFVVFQECLKDEAAFERIAFEIIEDASCDGIRQIELRFSPAFSTEVAKLDWHRALSAIVRGLKEGEVKTGVRSGLLCTISREYDLKAAHETLDFVMKNRAHFIGLDLAGPEIDFPCRMFEEVFRRAQQDRMPITIHAGEADGPQNVWEAIDLLGATRIGHGIRSIEDTELVRRLARDQILLEICPFSNWVTQGVRTLQEHPLARFLDAGVPVCINTDDPGIFGNTMQTEIELCRKEFGFTDRELSTLSAFAEKHCFM